MSNRFSFLLIIVGAIGSLIFVLGCDEKSQKSSQGLQPDDDREKPSLGNPRVSARKDDAKELLGAIRESEEASARYIDNSSIVECESLLLEILDHDLSDEDSGIVEKLMTRMAELDPALTMGLIAARPEGKVREMCLDMFFSKLTKIDPSSAISLSRLAQTTRDISLIKSTLSSSLPDLPISSLVDLLDDPTLSEREVALLHSSIGACAGYKDMSYEEVLKINVSGGSNDVVEKWAIVKSSSSPVELAELISGDEDVFKRLGNSLPTISGNYAHKRPQEASDWIVSLPDSEKKFNSLRVSLHLWLARDSASAGDWVNGLEESVSKDYARQTIAIHLRDKGDLELAKQWADSISDEKTRNSITFGR